MKIEFFRFLSGVEEVLAIRYTLVAVIDTTLPELACAHQATRWNVKHGIFPWVSFSTPSNFFAYCWIGGLMHSSADVTDAWNQSGACRFVAKLAMGLLQSDKSVRSTRQCIARDVEKSSQSSLRVVCHSGLIALKARSVITCLCCSTAGPEPVEVIATQYSWLHWRFDF